MSEQEQFALMLATLSHTDNVERKRAEATYDATKQNAEPAWLVVNLAQVGQTSPNLQAGQMAFTLLRRLLSNDDYGDRVVAMDPAAKQTTRDALLAALSNSQIEAPRLRACATCVAAMGSLDSKDGRNDWPSLWQTLLTAIQDPNQPPALRAACNTVFAEVAVVLAETYFATQLGPLSAAFGACMSDASAEVVKAAFSAYEATCTMVGSIAHIQTVRTQLPAMIEAVKRLIKAGDYSTAKSGLKALVQLGMQSSKLFVGHEQLLLTSMYEIAATPAVLMECRHFAVEVILGYAEAHRKQFRKMAGFETQFFQLMFQYMLTPDYDEEWGNTPDLSDEAPEDDFHCGATAIDRISVVLKGTTIQQLATQTIMANINSAEWQHRVAAISVLTYIMEGCKEQLESFLDTMVDQIILPKLTDEHPKVRACAIQAVTQAGSDFCPKLLTEHGAKILPPLALLLQESVPRVAALAAASVEQMLDDMGTHEEEEDVDKDKRFVVPFVDPLCRALVQQLQTTTISFVQETALHALSTIIQSSGKAIESYVPHLAPIFVGFLEQPESAEKELQKIKSRALECITLLACSGGKVAFAQWAQQVCEYLNAALVSGLANDDPRLRYVLRGCTCMVECLKEGFMPYIPTVLGKLIEMAALDCEPVEVDEEESERNKDKEGVEYVKLCVGSVGQKTVRINTAQIEDKDQAFTIILAFVQELGANLHTHMQRLTEVSAQALGFQGSSEVRDTAAEVLSSLGDAYVSFPQEAAGFVQYITPLLLEAIKEEDELEVAKTEIASLSAILKKVNAAPAADAVTTAAKVLHAIFVKSLESVTESQQAMQQAEDDDEKEELQDEVDDQEFLMREAAEACGAFLKVSPDVFFPLYQEHFIPMVGNLLVPNASPMHHRLGLHSLCDLAEFGGAHAVPHIPQMVSAAGQYSSSDDEDVRQAAIYLVKVFATLSATQLPQPHQDSITFLSGAASSLVGYLNSPKARETSELAVVCNTASTLLEMLQHFGSSLPAAEIFPAVTQHLPVKDDTVEAERVHDRLVQWAQQADHPLMTNTAFRGPVLAKVRESKYISEAAKAALATLQ